MPGLNIFHFIKLLDLSRTQLYALMTNNTQVHTTLAFLAATLLNIAPNSSMATGTPVCFCEFSGPRCLPRLPAYWVHYGNFLVLEGMNNILEI